MAAFEKEMAMRTSKMTSILRVISATALAVAVAGSVVPASAGVRMGGGGFGGGGFHGGGFGGPGFAGRGFNGGFGRGFAGRGFHHGFFFRGQRFVVVGSPGWGGYYSYYCSPYWWAVNPWLCM